MLGSKITNLPRANFYPTKKVKFGYAARIFKKSIHILIYTQLHSFKSAKEALSYLYNIARISCFFVEKSHLEFRVLLNSRRHPLKFAIKCKY